MTKLCRVMLLGAALLAPMAGSMPGTAQAAQEVLYGITFDNELIRLDTTTGAGTLVGPLSTEMLAIGLSVRGNRLYTFDQQDDVIRELDPNTGATLNTIDVGFDDLIGEGAIEFRSDGVGFLAVADGGLFRFDIDAGTSTFLGIPSRVLDGLAFDGSDVLYGLSQTANTLYIVNQTDGSLTSVGSTGIVANDVLGGLAFRSDGVLFGTAIVGGVSQLYTFDTATGAATLVGPTGFSSISGLAFYRAAVVPEPGSLTLAGLGLGLTGIAVARRRRAAAAR